MAVTINVTTVMLETTIGPKERLIFGITEPKEIGVPLKIKRATLCNK